MGRAKRLQPSHDQAVFYPHCGKLDDPLATNVKARGFKVKDDVRR